jgi:hypothetical protein
VDIVCEEIFILAVSFICQAYSPYAQICVQTLLFGSFDELVSLSIGARIKATITEIPMIASRLT